MAGIGQGWSQNGLLFNIVIDLVLSAVRGGDRWHNILAYAGNLSLLADDPE